jgi:hypothetical protein
MPITIRLKGSSESGFHGHSGIPGHLGGSAPSGAPQQEGIDKLVSSNKYSGMSFSDASDAVIADAEAGDFSGGWHKISDTAAKTYLPEDGYARISIQSENYAAGKFAAGTTAQQRYRITVKLVTFKANTNKTTGFDRWNSKDLWGVTVKRDGLDSAKVRAQKKFDSMFK